MRLFYCIAVSILLLAACNYERINGNGHVTTESRKVGPYHKVVLEGDMDIEFTRGPLQDAVIEADDNLLPYIELRTEGDALIVGVKENVNLSSHKGIRVKLSSPDVNDLSLPGSGNIIVTNDLQTNEPVYLGISGSGNIKGAINSPAIKTDISGSGNLELTGDTKDLKVGLSGSGHFRGATLHSENAKVDISGSGGVDVHASVKLDISISGSGNVKYRGAPQVSSSISGSGNVSKED